METTLKLLDEPADHSTYETSLSPDYINAVNHARFVNGFGIAALIISLLALFGIGMLGAAVGFGVSLFVLRYGSERFYRLVGQSLVLLSLAPLALIGLVFLLANRSPGEEGNFWLWGGLALGIAALPALIKVGVGVSLIARGRSWFFLILGMVVIAAALLGMPVVELLLSSAILGKGIETIEALNRSDKTDADWQPTFTRALTGVVCSAISVGILLVGKAVSGE